MEYNLKYQSPHFNLVSGALCENCAFSTNASDKSNVFETNYRYKTAAFYLTSHAENVVT